MDERIKARDAAGRFVVTIPDEERAARTAFLKHAEYLRRRSRRQATAPRDPLLLLTENELAYIAGIVDGEGTIHVTGSSGKKTCYPIVGIAMTHRGVIDWLSARWGGVKVSEMPRRNPKWLPQFAVRLSGKRAQLLCRLILPFLIVKRRQAELVIEFPTEARIGPGIKIAASEIYHSRLLLLEKINSLNHTPRNPKTRRGRLAREALHAIQQN